VVVLSIHWGANWGYEIPESQRTFAHELIDRAGVDLVHGHSSHHVKGIEVHQDRPILYGCGDFLTDYEGIRGRESYRGDLGLMYFAEMRIPDGRLISLTLVPTQVRRFQVRRANRSGARRLRRVINREGEALGTWVEPGDEAGFRLDWA
jgi:poly-gamma-glutamate synthesis protein (capsule biosynthesis protein)